MTPAQLEAAARHYCTIKGIDPDQTIAHGPPPDANGVSYAVCLYSPQWRLIANQIHDIWAAQQAINHACPATRNFL